MSAFDRQVGGDHYRDMEISPFEFIERNKLSFGVGNVIKYLCRWRTDSGSGIEDLRKAKHYIDLLIELELNHDHDLEVIEVGDVTDSSDPGWTDRLT
tara:strand:- start:472 stop:762 length:291 start_codon:yes stop_codon:yes gene_type:complete